MKFIPFLLTAGIILSIPQYSYGIDNKKQEDIYRAAIPERIKNFDPVLAETQLNQNLIKNIYNTLVDYRTTREKQGERYTDIVPSIAEEWNVSSDRKIYNFKLKDNVFFHNGRKCTAFDVKHTMERLANPFILPSSMEWIFKDMQIKGLKKYQQDCLKKLPEPDLEGVKVLDHNLVQIVLDKPSPQFLKELAMPVFSIIAREELEKWGREYSKHAVGTGPFSLVSFDENTINLKKNNRYFEKDTPIIKNLVYKVIPDISQEYKLFDKGELDQTDIPDSQIDALYKKEQFNTFGTNVFDTISFNDPDVSQIIKQVKPIVTFLGISTKKKEINTIKARQALNYAINKSKLISNVLSYKAISLNGIFPESFPGSSNNRNAPYPYDIIKAKKLLYEAGLIDYSGDGILEYKSIPVSLNFWYYQDEETEKVCNSLKSDLEAVGFKINLKKSTDWKQFINKITSGQADIYHFSWRAKYPDPDKFITPLFYSKNIGSTNLFGFHNPEIDKMLESAKTITDETFRYKMYRTVEKRIIEQAPWVFLYQPVKYLMLKPNIYGMQIHPILQEVTKFTYFNMQNKNVTLSKNE